MVVTVAVDDDMDTVHLHDKWQTQPALPTKIVQPLE